MALVVLFTLFFFQNSITKSYAQTDKVTVNTVDISRVNQMVVNGVSYVELREIFKALGWSIKWNNANKSITCTKDDNILIFKINSREVIFNEEIIILDCEVIIYDGVAIVHSKFVAEHFGQIVRWDREKNITVTPDNYAIDILINGKRNIVITGNGIIVNVLEPYYMDTLLEQISYANSMLNRNNPEDALVKYNNIIINLCDKESPKIYGEVLNSMGNAYSMMASKKNTRKNIQLAISNYEKALMYTENDLKSLLLNNLGNSYKTLWEVSGKKEILNKALDCYLDALNYCKYSILNEALIYYNIGMLYNDLDNIGMSEHYLNMSYDIYQKVSEEYFLLPSLPDLYTEVQFGLGNVCKGLLLINSSNDYFQKAKVAYESVLDVWNIEEKPYSYGEIQKCIGELYKIDGTYESLIEAVNKYNESLKFVTLEDQPVEYASILVAIGDTYMMLHDKMIERDIKEQAIASYEEAKRVLQSSEHPIKYQYINNKLNHIQRKDKYKTKVFDWMKDALKNILNTSGRIQ